MEVIFILDNIKDNEQNNRQDIRSFRDSGSEKEQEQKNRELRDNFKNIHEFMKSKHYE